MRFEKRCFKLSRSRKDGEGENVQAVERALSLLEVLAKENAAVSISDLAKKSGLKLTTVHPPQHFPA